MKKLFFLILSLLFFFIGINMLLKNKFTQKDYFPVITIIYDNNPYNKELKTSWGFSCIIKTVKHTILFDTGANGDLLLENMKKLKIDPKKIDFLILSHNHYDHIGGLHKFLENNPSCTIYIPKSFPKQFKNEIKEKGPKIIEVDNPCNICTNVKTTGEMGTEIKEQSLIIKTDKGNLVIVGCAHPGILKIIEKSNKLIENNILLVIGGFHLLNKNETELKKIIEHFKNLNIKYVAPCHCSGDLTRKLFSAQYKKKYINAGVGKIIEIKNL
ncbi:MAG: MBL fold metallo-hydrolase [bacterium]